MPVWEIGIAGPLVKPAASEETFFYPIGDRITDMAGTTVAPTRFVDYSDCCTPWPSVKSSSRDAEVPVTGGSQIFGIDTRTGELIWSRSTSAGAFVGLTTTFPQSGGFSAWTADGQIIQPQRESGGILPMPVQVGAPLAGFLPGGALDFATLRDGTFIPIDPYGEPA